MASFTLSTPLYCRNEHEFGGGGLTSARLQCQFRNFPQDMFQKIDFPFLLAAFMSFVASVALWFLVNHDYGAYVGLWVPSILVFWVGVRLVILAGQTKTYGNK